MQHAWRSIQQQPDQNQNYESNETQDRHATRDQRLRAAPERSPPLGTEQEPRERPVAQQMVQLSRMQKSMVRLEDHRASLDDLLSAESFKADLRTTYQVSSIVISLAQIMRDVIQEERNLEEVGRAQQGQADQLANWQQELEARETQLRARQLPTAAQGRQSRSPSASWAMPQSTEQWSAGPRNTIRNPFQERPQPHPARSNLRIQPDVHYAPATLTTSTNFEEVPSRPAKRQRTHDEQHHGLGSGSELEYVLGHDQHPGIDQNRTSLGERSSRFNYPAEGGLPAVRQEDQIGSLSRTPVMSLSSTGATQSERNMLTRPHGALMPSNTMPEIDWLNFDNNVAAAAARAAAPDQPSGAFTDSLLDPHLILGLCDAYDEGAPDKRRRADELRPQVVAGLIGKIRPHCTSALRANLDQQTRAGPKCIFTRLDIPRRVRAQTTVQFTASVVARCSNCEASGLPCIVKDGTARPIIVPRPPAVRANLSPDDIRYWC